MAQASRHLADFWTYVDRPSGKACWTWTGTRNRQGYGFYGRTLAHRHSMTLKHGQIPSGAFVLHRCDNPPCVNPTHLYFGTRADNMRDALARGQHPGKPRTTHCAKGHEKAGDNLIVRKADGAHVCRRCELARKIATEERRRRRDGVPRRKMIHEEREEIRSLRRAGLSLRQIAKRTGRAYMTVWLVVQEANQ